MSDGRPPARDGTRWMRTPSLQVYLVSLVALFTVVAAALGWYQRTRMLNEVRDTTRDRVAFQAGLAADDIRAAVALTRESVMQLAANPALAVLVASPEPAAAGCTLEFTGAGPFMDGHIDVIGDDGTTRCSSRELGPPGTYVDAPWLRADAGVTIVGPVRDPATGRDALVVVGPIRPSGTVATFLVIGGLDGELSRRFGGPLDARFTVAADSTLPADGEQRDTISATAPVASLGWTVWAAVDRDTALADVQSVGRTLVLIVAGALLVLLAATHAMYRRLARPIEQLRESATRAMAGDASGLARISGPSEVVSLAQSFAALADDITAELARRERAEEDARASEASYRTLFAAHPVPMWIYDAETLAFLEVNDTAIATYGYARDEFLAMTLLEIRPPEDAAAVVDVASTAGTVSRSGPWRHFTKAETPLDVEITSHAVTFAGRAARFVMAEDVTQRERSRRLIEQAQRMESLGLLAGGIAHDFNNLLAVILNYAEFVAEEVRPAATADPEQWSRVLDDLHRIGDAGHRAAQLTHQLLAFARGESAPTTAVDVNEVVTQLEPMLSRTLGERVQLALDLDAAIPPAMANAAQLEQVLVNLAVNARDAMPDGGHLAIDTGVVDVDEDHGAERPELAAGHYVRLRVSDNGTGMAPEVRDRAFEPFFTTKEGHGGTGFGLATVYGIVTRAGGTVRIYSEPGMGTSVTVLLPATDSPTRATTVTPSSPPGSTPSETVLIVEDDDNVREVAERILSEAGYQVLTAARGADALATAQQHSGELDLVLTDVVMPDMLGNELAARLRQHDPALRIVIMSGYAPPVLVNGGTLASDTPLLEKPFSAQRLRDAVRAALGDPPSPPMPPA